MQHPCDGLLHLRVRDFAGRTFDQLVPPCQLFLPQRLELVQKSTRKQRKVGAVKRCGNPLEHFGQAAPLVDSGQLRSLGRRVVYRNFL